MALGNQVCYYLFKNHEYKYNSDNFLLTNGDRIFAFPERGRLNKDFLDKLKIKETENSDVVYGKIQNVFSESELKKKHRLIMSLLNNSKLNCVKISNLNGNKSLDGIHRYLKESPEYTFTAYLILFHSGSLIPQIYSMNRQIFKSFIST